MFLSLEYPGGDKGISIYARDLAGDIGFDRGESISYTSERFRANCAINGANRLLGVDRHLAFHSLFNQFAWEGTTGWEYWCDDDKDQLLIKHGLLVAAALQVPLHVQQGKLMDRLYEAAMAAGIKFDFDVAQPIQNLNRREFASLNDKIAAGGYFVFTDVVLPASMPAPPELL